MARSRASIDELSPQDRRHVAALVESLRKKAAGERAGNVGTATREPE
jgi:hypothetical protein